MEDYKALIGNRLKYLRKKRNLPITDIIEKLNIARPTYTGWEMGHRSPNGERLVQLAVLFDTTVDFITGKIDEEMQPDKEIIQAALEKVSVQSLGKTLSKEKGDALADIVLKLLKD